MAASVISAFAGVDPTNEPVPARLPQFAIRKHGVALIHLYFAHQVFGAKYPSHLTLLPYEADTPRF